MFDVNKSSGEVQQENSDSRGLKTILGKVGDYMTSEFCWDPAWGGARNNIAFRFRLVSDRQSLQMAETHKLTLAGMPSAAINEARRDQGRPPIGDPDDENNPYNQLMANTSQGLVRLEDIPTARELAERTKPEPVGPGGGSSTPAPAQKGYSELAEMIGGLRSQIEVSRPAPVASIAEGAVKVQLGGGDRLPDQTLSRETTFETDGRGRIMKKVEVETVGRPPEQVSVDQKLVELKRAELEAAERRAEEPVEREIIRQTEFEIDDHGAVIRKVETEHADQ
jgi:hypothetical protein